jgi:hypothetical protein
LQSTVRADSGGFANIEPERASRVLPTCGALSFSGDRAMNTSAAVIDFLDQW